MRTWGGVVGLSLAMGSVAASENVLGDLFYTTATACAALQALPTQQDLRPQLLSRDTTFRGSVTLSKSDTTTGCALHVAVRGELQGEGDHDAFALVSQVDASLAKMLDAHILRGSDTLQDLTLQRVRVKVDNRDFSVDAKAVGEVATGELTLNGDGCGGFDSKNLLEDLLADRVGDVAVVPGQVDVANCAIDLDIMGRSPVLTTVSEAASFLKAMDVSLIDWFGTSATKQSTAKLRSAHLAFSPPKSVMLEAAMTTNLAAQNTVNAPSKNITTGILMGLMMLTAMLVGVVYQKKRHEQSLQMRHDNASRAAQIRRVSYRMGYEPVSNKETQLGADEEEKDGLL